MANCHARQLIFLVQVNEMMLDEGYRAMADDEQREAEVVEWCNALAVDVDPVRFFYPEA
jgi:hypothetical protein